MTARHVLVTAGASGIGAAIAEMFLDRGDRVTICDVDAGALDRIAARLPALSARLADVADAGTVDAMVAGAVAAAGPVEILINNAGIAGPVGGIEDTDPDAWARCFAVNIHGPFHLMRAVIPAMKAAGHGSIINISTASTVTGLPGRSSYIASKFALEGLTKNAARELGPAGIRVNAIRPGFMDTDRMRGILGAVAARRGVAVDVVEAEALGFISLRTKIQPGEIGEMAFFLASATASNITGQIIGVDGNCEWEG
jgi:NAD(P)-dependent dehydrogenase (short-subunit alcohol dehydrogenase family)